MYLPARTPIRFMSDSLLEVAVVNSSIALPMRRSRYCCSIAASSSGV